MHIYIYHTYIYTYTYRIFHKPVYIYMHTYISYIYIYTYTYRIFHKPVCLLTKQVHAAVTAAFGATVPNIVATDFSGMSMAEQLKLVSSTTLAVSPCGGISMILPFMPEGSHAVLVNYMLAGGEWPRHGECDPKETGMFNICIYVNICIYMCVGQLYAGGGGVAATWGMRP